jgi:phage terminase large subunit-like protein
VSTWLDAGSDWVYNLTVEGEHEYIANGVVVHNCDETAAWLDARKGDTLDTSWNNLMLGLRLGQSPRCFVTTTPKRVKLIRQIMERSSTVVTTDTTYANLKNLAPSFKESVLATYEGTRIGRQELAGEMLTDVDGALWTLDNIDSLRVRLEAA